MKPPALAADAATGWIAAILTADGRGAAAWLTVGHLGAGAGFGAGAALAARASAGLGRVRTPLADVSAPGVWTASAAEAAGSGAGEAGVDEPKMPYMFQTPPDELWDAGSGAGGGGGATAAAGFDEPKTPNMLQPPPDEFLGRGFRQPR